MSPATSLKPFEAKMSDSTIFKRLYAFLTIQQFMRLARFGLVGGAATLAYGVIAYGLVSYGKIGDVLASVIAYAAAIPVSFLGQKFFAFRSTEPARQELVRFLVVQGFNLVLAAGVMALVTNVFDLASIWGIVAVMLTIPMITYILLAVAVFRRS